MRIFTATLATETNTFAPMPTGLLAFDGSGASFAAGAHPARPTLFAGPLWAARERARTLGWTHIEGPVAATAPAGLTTGAAYATLRQRLLDALRAALPVDAVALGLHGAMVADGTADCEGDLLTQVRALVGPGVAVGATLDPHGHLSLGMVQAANLLVIWKHYPHTDSLDRAFELVDGLAGVVAGRLQPVPALVDCGLITTVHTTQPPGNALVALACALEQRPGVLSVSLNHGFPWGDVPDMGTRVLAYAHADAALAERAAHELAAAVLTHREALHPLEPDIDGALDQALASSRTPVVIADGADNPGGGAPGDATWFLQRMLERGITQAAVAPLVDPGVVELAFNAGGGARLSLRLGGKTAVLSGPPLDVTATVLRLQPAHHMAGLAPGERVDCGDSVLLDVQGISVVVVSRRVQAMGTDLLEGLGCVLADQRLIVLKSSQHFRAHFEPVAARIVYSRAPGVVTADWSSLPYRNIRRPLWPMDPQARPQARTLWPEPSALLR